MVKNTALEAAAPPGLAGNVHMPKFKIRQISTGLFSDGKGRSARFRKSGKIWNRLSSVVSHIDASCSYKPSDTEIVQYEMIETGAKPMQLIYCELEKKRKEKHLKGLQGRLCNLKHDLKKLSAQSKEKTDCLLNQIATVEVEIRNATTI